VSVESEIIWLRILLQVHREQDAAEATQLDFDAWYRARTERAHAAYMKRTSQHLVCDWRITRSFSPEEISRFFNIPMNEAES